MILPQLLAPGDRVAIVSPSGIIAPERVFGAMLTIQSAGFEPIVMSHALDRCGTMAGTDAARISDLEIAFSDPSVRAVLCSRGGYGAVRLLDRLSHLPLADDPKWLIGYSDITALHCLVGSLGIASLHAPMARHLAEEGGSDPCSRELFDILQGNHPDEISYTSHPLAGQGTATGVLRGGNLSVMSGLFGTPFSPLLPDTILLMEDIAEPIYKVERMLYNLQLSGALDSLAGLIFGQFTLYEPSRDFATMEQMSARITSNLRIPVAMNFPAGHVRDNRPLLLNTPVTLSVTPSVTTLKFLT